MKVRLKMAVVLLVFAATANAAETVPGPTPSIAGTKSVQLIGKQFELKFHSERGGIEVYEYFPGSDTPEHWLELVDFTVYSMIQPDVEPVRFAQSLAANVQAKLAGQKYSLIANADRSQVILDFFLPDSTRKEGDKSYLEFNAFKFYRDPASGHMISFHYARSMEAPAAGQQEAWVEDFKRIRAEVANALATYPTFTK